MRSINSLYRFKYYLAHLTSLFFKKKTTLAMRVPSAIVKQEFNLLINPNHKDSYKVEIIKSYPFVIDNRLAK